jgi:hypothetical protein
VARCHERSRPRLPSATRCVVGIDVAQASPVVCAVAAPSGAVRRASTPIAARAAGDAQLVRWPREWGEPPTLLLGLEATGSWWEPLYDPLTHADPR